MSVHHGDTETRRGKQPRTDADQRGGEQVVTSCVVCGAEKATKPTKRGERLPKGWKDAPLGRLCNGCLHERYMLRAACIPIHAVEGSDWKQLNAALHRQWAICTGAINYVTTLLYAADTPRMPEQTKLPSMPRPYLYPQVRARFPDLQPTSVVSLIQAATNKYARRRLDVIWRSSATLPTARYPQPLPIHNASWKVRFGDRDGREVAVVECNFGGEPWVLVLRSIGFARQLRMIRQLTDGQAIQGELALYRSGRDTMAKLVGWFPKPPGRELDGELLVVSQPDCLLLAAPPQRDCWRLNGDRVRAWIAGHRQWLLRRAEDRKAETRPEQPTSGQHLRREMRTGAAKYRHRIETFLHEASAQLASFALRQRVRTVRYDDTERSYCPEFSWAALRERIVWKLDQHGIGFVHVNASGDVAQKDQGPLEEENHD